MPDTSSLSVIQPAHVLAAGGFDELEMLDDVSELEACTDAQESHTPCVARAREHPFIMFDLGEEMDIFSVEIFLMPPAPPSPPIAPSPEAPPFPSIPPFPSPRSPKPNPPPPLPPSWPPVPCAEINNNNCKSGTDGLVLQILHKGNGICEDGSPTTVEGVVDAEPGGQVCDYGLDVDDCGERPCSKRRFLQTNQDDEISDFCYGDSTSARHCKYAYIDDGQCDIWCFEGAGACNYDGQDCVGVVFADPYFPGFIGPPPPPLSTSAKVGWLEIYVSRNLALFGTRCATLDTNTMYYARAHLRCMEDGYDARGRYVYVRSFESNNMLRIDGVKIYKNAAGSTRRLVEDQVAEDATEPVSKAHKVQGDEYPEDEAYEHPQSHEFPQRDDSLHKTRMRILAENMVNLTKTVCKERHKNPAVALEARRDASILWAELDEGASNTSCFDCVAMQNLSCLNWFAHNYGMSRELGLKAERLRSLRENMQKDYPERRRKLEEGLGASCCRRSLKTGEKVCSKEFCHGAMKQNARQRMAHVLRRMHESGHIELSVQQRVAVDVLAPHLHTDPRCRSASVYEKRSDAQVTETECIASSLASHIADRHGLSKESLDQELGKYGLSIAKMLAQPFKLASTASQAMGNFRSSPEFAADVAKMKERRRKMEEQSPLEQRSSHRQTTRPHGRALKSAKSAVEEGVPTNGARGYWKNRADLKKVATMWMNNVSNIVKKIHGASDKSRSASLMPQVHSSHKTLMPAVGDTIAAVVSSDGSVMNTAARSATALGSIMQRATSVMDTVEKKESERALRSSKRRLSRERVESYYAQIDERMESRLIKEPAVPNWQHRRLSSADVGWTTPDWHVKNYGWLASAVDWREAISNTHRASRKLLERHDYVLQHVEETGHLPSGRVKDEHLTGFGFLDLNAPPSLVGNMFRELHDWMTNRHASESLRRVHKRRMHESRSRSRMNSQNAQNSALIAAVGATIFGHDPFDAVRETLETAHHDSHARRLAESFLGAAASVPIMATSMSNKYASYEATTGVNWALEIARYLVYNTILCYLYDPSDDSSSDGDFGDGTKIKTHRTRKMCFPAIAAGPTRMELFRKYYGVGDMDFNDLEFEKACRSDAVKGVLGALGEDWSKNMITTAPMGSILRVAEGIDSIRNLARSGAENATEVERGAAIVCGLSQLGGILFSALAIALSLALLVCAPIGSAVAILIFKWCKRVGNKNKERARLHEQIKEIVAERNLNAAARLDKGGESSGTKSVKGNGEERAEDGDSFPEDDWKLGTSNDPPWFGFRTRTDSNLFLRKGDDEDKALSTKSKLATSKKAISTRYTKSEEETYTLLNANV